MPGQKLSRNAPCLCGSGKKYKKCCLDKGLRNAFEDDEKKTYPFLDKVRKLCPDSEMTLIQSEEEGMIKMSAVILDYVEDLLSVAIITPQDQKAAITFAVTAWNLSLIEEEKRDRYLDDLFYEAPEVISEEMEFLLDGLIHRKHLEYPFLNRFIVDFTVTQKKGSPHLAVASLEYPTLESDMEF